MEPNEDDADLTPLKLEGRGLPSGACELNKPPGIAVAHMDMTGLLRKLSECVARNVTERPVLG